MKCLVTGAAGFIGSTLARALLDRGDEVVGLDCFTDFYDRSLKEKNLEGLLSPSDEALGGVHGRKGFTHFEADLTRADLAPFLDGVEVVFHEAAQPGVRASWGENFHHYTQNNVLATQRLLEACLKAGVGRVVCASSSSVYGECDDLPAREDSPLRPISPYGVTKVAAEHLSGLYYKNYGLQTSILRYFTVYGPRQRPDMAFSRFIRAAAAGREIEIYGDGFQSRDFTYVDDVVAATLAAAQNGRPGQVYNIGGGSRANLREVLETLTRIMDQELKVTFGDKVKGDVRHTAADISRARDELGYRPRTALSEGLAAEVAWLREMMVYPGPGVWF